MFHKNEKGFPILNMDVVLVSMGMKCEIGMNKKFFDTLSEEKQFEITNLLQTTFQKINKIIEKDGDQ